MANLFLNSWATTIFGRCVISVLLLALALNISTASHPTHRYSFDANANDSIGNAHGTVIGNASITNGQLLLNGMNGCVQLPANLFTNSKSLTLEIWFENQQYVTGRQLWSFAGSPFINYVLLHLAQVSSGNYGGLTINTMVNSVPIPAGKPHHLVWTQDEASHTARVFLNGQLYGQNTNFTATPGTTTTASYLGGDGLFLPIKGSISEFRIYPNALSHLEVLQSASLGPDALPASGDAITNLFMRAPSHLALHSITRPPVFADFTNQSGVNLTSLPEIGFTSSDTNVLEPATNGYVHAVGLGTADLIVTYNGHSATASVTVVAARQFALAHRYNFHGTPGSTNLPDLAGAAPGIVVNGGVFTNSTLLFLDGGNDHVDLPDGILSSLSEVTMETWVTGAGLNGAWWPRVFDFGAGPYGTYFFLAPSVLDDNFSTNRQFIRFAVARNGLANESPRLTGKPWMADGFETHLAVTYSPARNASKLYVNGVLADSGPAPYPLSLINDTNNWLGRSQYPGDAFFRGVFDEFRIYRTVLEASEVAASFALGPDVIGADYALQGQQIDNQLKLSWGPSASWCVLETAPALATGINWTNAAVTPVFNNGRMEVTVPISDTARFFRLAAP